MYVNQFASRPCEIARYGRKMDSSVFETAKELFLLLDVDKKGYILKHELSQIGDGFTESQLHSVFSALDKEGEGKITLEDFTEAFIASSSGQYNDENKQNTGEPSGACTASEGEECFSLHNDFNYCDSDINVNKDTNPSRDTDHFSEEFSHDCTVSTDLKPRHSNSKNCSQTKNEQMFNDDYPDNDDIFEGEGLLHADTQTYGSSPSRPHYLKSPSLNRKKRAVHSESKNQDQVEPEITDRSPPDGNEGDNGKRRRSSTRSRKSVNSEKKSVKTQVCMPSTGFAKDAIIDLLKIVDAQTLANLGLYANTTAAWRRDFDIDSSDIFGKGSNDDKGIWSPTAHGTECRHFSSRDMERTQEFLSSESHAHYSEAHLSESEACSCNDFSSLGADSQGMSVQSEIGSCCTSEEGTTDSRQGMFSPLSACSDYAGSLERHPEFDSTLPLDDRDTNENFFNLRDQALVACKSTQPPSIGAKMEKEKIGNLIFDNDSEGRADLYDRILSISGVELNSRLSSSESSLHDLILEAEVAKKSAALVEDWDSVMKRINGVSLFGGNQTIRYLWQQLSLYHTDLVQPFEDFLKCVVAEVNRAYSKCQELENMLNSKAEQHEREVARVYDDMDQLLSREKEELQSKQNEREEHLRADFNRNIEIKEADLMDSLRSKADIESKLEKSLDDYHTLKIAKEKLEKQLSISIASEQQLRNENDYVTQENRVLNDRIATYIQNVNEMQDQVIKVSKVAETSKENYRRCYRKYQDALEEKEYFDMNISNLTQELQDLRNANKSLQERVDTSLNTSILWREGQVSPRSPNSPDLHEKIGSRMFGFPNGIMPISQSQRNSLVSEPSFDESIPDVTVTNPPSLPVPDVIPTRTKAVSSPPKDASTPVKGKGMNAKTERTLRKQETIPAPVACHTGQEYKVIFVGDAAVGKTSLIRKIGRGTFSSRRESTTSPDFLKKTVTVKNRSITLNIWDTVGQERCSYVLKVEGFDQQLTFRFNSLPPSYFRKADVVVLVYDVIEEVSFINVKSWIKTIYEYTDENVLLVLCGNKNDLDHRRKVKEDKAAKVAKINDAIYLESSAKTGYNVATLCETIASTLLERDETVIIRENSVKIFHQDLLNMSKSNMKSCC